MNPLISRNKRLLYGTDVPTLQNPVTASCITQPEELRDKPWCGGLLDRWATRLAQGCMMMAEHDGDNLLAYLWAKRASNRYFWHDSVLVMPGEALVFNVWVSSSHRGQGLAGRLLTETWHHLQPCRVFTCVEEGNVASRRFHEKAGFAVKEVNVLYKFFGRNFASGFPNRNKTFILLGARRNRY